VNQPLRLRLARNLVNLRYARDLSQAALAQISGLDRSYIGSIEQARRNVSIDTIDRIADALGVDAQSLLATFESAR
jgi:transcriptional regulator with XRE-family HTH domain